MTSRKMKFRYCVIILLVLTSMYQFILYKYPVSLFGDIIHDAETAIERTKPIFIQLRGGDFENIFLTAEYIDSRSYWIIRSCLLPNMIYDGTLPIITIRQRDGKIMKIENYLLSE